MAFEIDILIGKRLRQRRTMMGLSQEALAKSVGITFQQVQKYEKGANAMNARRLCEFAEVLRVPVSYFFGETKTASASDKEHAHASDRQSLELSKAFHRVVNESIRKRICDLVRAVADCQIEE